jgi:Mn-dependent DtxR family transcriptional regulator
MSTIRFMLLCLLETNPELGVPQIADALGWGDRYVRKHLDKARGRGLVSRQDARFRLTAAGLRRLDYVRAHNLIEEFGS